MRVLLFLSWAAVTTNAAFGPSQPLLGVPSNTGNSNGSTLTMRLAQADMRRRQKMNQLFKTYHTTKTTDDSSSSSWREQFVRVELLSDSTATLLEQSHWKVRRALLRKLRAVAYEYDIVVDPSFGEPPTPEQRQAVEQEQGAKRKAERAAYHAELAAAEQSRLAKKAEETARRQAAEERAAQRKAERMAAKKAEEERIVAEKKRLEEERIAAEKKAEEERIAAEKKAEEERIAAEKKAEEERIAAEKAEEERIAAVKKAEEERIAAEMAAKRAEEERLAAEAAAKAEEEARLAAEAAAKAEEEARLAAEQKAEQERLAAEEAAKKAEEERMAAEAAAAAAQKEEVSSSTADDTAATAAAAPVAVTTQMIKELRESTGAGMMDCKKALMESNGDIEEAAVFLRKKGLAKADKKASRVAAEGKIAFLSGGNKAVLVEVNCETDFVGKDANFAGFCDQVAQAAIGVPNDSIEALLASPIDGAATVEETRQALVAKIGENIQVRRMASRGGEGSTVGAYVHMNRIGVLVELEGGDEQLCTDVAMHVAAMNPPFAVPEDVPADVLDKERKILSDQALESGKPPQIVEKMVEGRIRKYLQEICLVSQPYVKDGDKTVGKLLEEKGAKIKGFTRIAVGEGIAKKEDNFAEEVAKMAGTSSSSGPAVAEPVAAEPVAAEPEPVVVAEKPDAASTPSEATPVTTKMIKELRESTGAGMMDCKKALMESNGDMEEAAVFLRKKGLAKADKKASRVAAEGKIAFSNDGSNKAVLVEINCETDFVGKDANFAEFCDKVAQAAVGMDNDSMEALLESKIDGGATVEETRQALVAKIGENIQVRRMASRGGEGSTVGAYIHMSRIGVLVELEGGDEQLCTDVAMHIAAMNPPFAVPEDVPADVLDKERKILSDQALESGKPPAIVEKMVEGRIRKYLQEICLVSQPYVKDGDKTVGKLLEEKGAKIKGFTRIAVGEGIAKKEDNFAEEVAKMAGTAAAQPEPAMA